MIKNFTHLNFDDAATRVKFKELLRDLFDKRPELIEGMGKAIDTGVRDKVITSKQASVMRGLLADVLGDMVDDSIDEMAQALGVDLNEIFVK